MDDGSEMHQHDDRLHVGKPLHKYSAPARRLQAHAVLCTHAEHKCAQCKHAQQLRGVLGAQGAIMPGASEQGAIAQCMAAHGVGIPGEGSSLVAEPCGRMYD